MGEVPSFSQVSRALAQEETSIYNRLRSIDEDVEFVDIVAGNYVRTPFFLSHFHFVYIVPSPNSLRLAFSPFSRFFFLSFEIDSHVHLTSFLRVM